MSLIAVNILLIPIVITNLGFAVYGLFLLAKLFGIQGPMYIFQFGVQTTLAKVVPQIMADKNDSKAAHYFWLFGFVALIVGVLAYGVVNLVGGFFIQFMQMPKTEMTTLVKLVPVISIGLTFGYLQFVLIGYLNGLKQFWATSIIEFLVSFLSSVSLIVLALAGAQLSTIVMMEVVIAGFCCALSLVFLFRCLPALRSQFSFQYLKSLQPLFDVNKDMKMFTVAGLSGMLFHQSDRIIIGGLLGPEMVGKFAMVMKIPRVIKIVSSTFSSTLLPSVSELHHKNEQSSAKNLFMMSFKMNLIVTGACVGGIVVMVQPLTNLLFKSTSAELYNSVVAGLSWNMLLPIGVAWSLYIAFSKSRKNYVMGSWLSTVIKIGFQLAALNMGLIWLSVSYAISFLPQAYIICHFLHREGYRLLKLLSIYANVALVQLIWGGLFSLVVNYLLVTTLPQVVAALILYGVGAVVIGYAFVFNKSERNIVLNFVGRRWA